MKKSLLVVLAIVLAVSMANCVGVQYAELKTLDDGTKVIQGGRTGVFGHDNSFVYVQPAPIKQAPIAQVAPAPSPVPVPAPAPQITLPEPRKMTVERSYTKSSTSWTGCPDKKPNRRAKNVKRSEEKEQWTEEVAVPMTVQITQAPTIPAQVLTPQLVYVPQPDYYPPAFSYGGGNPSVGNAALGSLFIAGGMIGAAAALRPDQTNIQQTGGGATLKNSNTANGGSASSSTGPINVTAEGGKAISNSKSDSNSFSLSQSDASAKNFTNVDVGVKVDSGGKH